MCTITNSSGSQHPFISWSDANEYIMRLVNLDDTNRDARILLFRDFVLDGTDLGGAQVSYATKEVVLRNSDGVKCTVYAFAIQDIYNKKVPVLDLCFFNTGGQQNDDTAHLWIGMEKDMNIHGNFLFLATKPSSNRMKVESMLLKNCKPLTVAQRTGDRFVGRRFRFTGTVGATISSESYDTDNVGWK